MCKWSPHFPIMHIPVVPLHLFAPTPPLPTHHLTISIYFKIYHPKFILIWTINNNQILFSLFFILLHYPFTVCDVCGPCHKHKITSFQNQIKNSSNQKKKKLNSKQTNPIGIITKM